MIHSGGGFDMRKFIINVNDISEIEVVKYLEDKHNLELHEETYFYDTYHTYCGIYFSHYTIEIETLDDITNIIKLLNKSDFYYVIIEENALTIKKKRR